MRKNCLIALVALICQVALVTARSGEDHWVWRTYSRRERAFKDNDIDRIASASRNTHEKQQRREPTTRRPLPGEPENDEIEDYVDADPTVSAAPNVGTRQFNPYASGNPFGGFGGAGQQGGQANGGQFAGGLGGFGGGGVGGGSPGVLVGPGGPTGIIGRQPLYPNIYQPGIGFGGGQNGLGFGQGQGQGLGGFPGNFGGFGGSAYPGVGGGFPGAQPGIGLGQGQGQFPGAGSQYPFGGFPGAGTNFNSNQFAAPGGQYPGVGQFPSNQYGGPQYTEGYGLSGFGQGQQGLPPTGFGGNYGASPFGFDEKAPTVAEGKSAKSVVIAPTSVNDKLSKKV